MTAAGPLPALSAGVRGKLGRLLARALAPILEEAMVAAMRKDELLVAIPADEYESYRETAEILDDPDALADLAASDEDERAGWLYD